MDNQKFYDDLLKSDDFARTVVGIVGGSFSESDEEKISRIIDEIFKYKHLTRYYEGCLGTFR